MARMSHKTKAKLLKRIADGATNAEIKKELGVAPKTTQKYRLECEVEEASVPYIEPVSDLTGNEIYLAINKVAKYIVDSDLSAQLKLSLIECLWTE
jgi:hypothetical protein